MLGQKGGNIVCTGATAQPGSTRGTDMWILQTDKEGHLPWEKRFNGEKDDTGHSITETYDGGFACLGVSQSYTEGGKDFWLVKTDANGNTQTPELPVQLQAEG